MEDVADVVEEETAVFLSNLVFLSMTPPSLKLPGRFDILWLLFLERSKAIDNAAFE